jgi:HPt (histidine-containing phosphotransfer) domain-containing protein
MNDAPIVAIATLEWGTDAALPILEAAAIDEFVEEVGIEAAATTLTTYLSEAERRLATLRTLAADQRAAIHVEAHTLKGSSGLFGLLRFSAAAHRLEQKSETMAADEYLSMRRDLEAVHADSRQALTAYLEKMRGAVALGGASR